MSTGFAGKAFEKGALDAEGKHVLHVMTILEKITNVSTFDMMSFCLLVLIPPWI